MIGFCESIVEEAALAWRGARGSYAVLAGHNIAPDIVLCDTMRPRLIFSEFAERVITEAI